MTSAARTIAQDFIPFREVIQCRKVALQTIFRKESSTRGNLGFFPGHYEHIMCIRSQLTNIRSFINSLHGASLEII